MDIRRPPFGILFSSHPNRPIDKCLMHQTTQIRCELSPATGTPNFLLVRFEINILKRLLRKDIFRISEPHERIER